MILVLLGPPGAGKGTQAVSLAAALGHLHLSTGDVLRRNLAEGTALGRQAQGYMKRGELVPDDVVIGMVRDRLGQDDGAPGVILDGFPRTVAQAEALDATVAQLGLSAPWAIAIEVGRDELIARLTGRRVCRAAGHPYHIKSMRPKKDGVCDIDGSELYQRADDTLEIVTRRLAVYESDTAPVLGYYEARGRLVKVAGDGGPAAVATRLKEAVGILSTSSR